MPPDAAIFLDRDGTLIEDVGYLSECHQVKLLPGAAEAVQAFNRGGWTVIIVTNQSGVARGMFDEARIHEVQAHVQQVLNRNGAFIDAYYFCPHGPDAGCACRKPRPGMLLQAAREHGIDLARSWMIGDKPSDVEAGRAAGCRTILFRDWGETLRQFHHESGGGPAERCTPRRAG